MRQIPTISRVDTENCTGYSLKLYPVQSAFLYFIFSLFTTFTTLAVDPPAGIWNYLEKNCVDCHDGADAEGQIDLYDLDFDLSNEETTRRWVLIHDQIDRGEMPPKEKKKRPDPDDSKAFLASLNKSLTDDTSTRANTVLRRLNRNEYQNTVRDLFNIELVVQGLPDDTPTDGFDNVGSGLAVSAEAIQAYLNVADQVLDAVFGPPVAPKKIYHKTNLLEQVDWRGNPQLENQIGKMFRKTGRGLVIFQSGYCPTNLVNFTRLKAPAGTYRAKFEVRAIQSDKPVTLRIYGGDTIVRRKENHLVGYFDVPPDEWTTIEFEDRLLEPGGTFQPKCYGTRDTRKDADTYPEPGIEIGDIIIEGPLEQWPPPSRKQLLGDTDIENGTIEDVKAIYERLLPAAFRRPVAIEEIDYYTGLFSNALQNPDHNFESALRVSLKMLLCSPEFLFLEESEDPTLSQFSLASRLSYFLWSAPPDRELRDLAAKGTLSRPDVLKSQTERLLNDKKSVAFTQNFTGQWLDLRQIKFTEPDPVLFPEFDELLRLSMLKETELFFTDILKNDLGLVNFLDSDFTYLNERLAKHYQIDGVEGQAFRKVTLPESSIRGGLLTQASLLKVTANGTNTSPVLRGHWVLEHILGTPTSPPPDNVGSVEPDIRGTTTLREKLEKHREAKECAGCHAKIDPIGFALEQFDPIGGFRSNYRTLSESGKRTGMKQHPITFAWVKYRIGLPVDSTGHMATGEPFTDIKEFKSILVKNPEIPARNLTRQIYTYALGRKLEFSDRPAVEDVVGKLRQTNYGFRSLIHEIIQSDTFQKP
ncbi:MAG: DUF1592 domain-containing protein [Verrucomicrobiales bacterium]|nr:DUF1592 domain-containing protein [Verrucomicrobiales bacterium]